MKILLTADVGRLGQGYYHAGDEAMFSETVRWYTKWFPHYSLGALSMAKNSIAPDLHEIVNLPFPANSRYSRIYLLKLMCKAILNKYLRINLYKSEENAFVDQVLSYHILHFTGGGNLYSMAPAWLSYVFFLVFIFHLNRKSVIMTSQTIGPLWGIDRLLSLYFLNLPKLITVREPQTTNTKKKYFIYRPRVEPAFDGAYTLPAKSKLSLSKTKSLRIGLSLHFLEEYGDKVLHDVNFLIKKTLDVGKVELILIPHILAKNTDEMWDLRYMHQLRIPKEIKVIDLLQDFKKITTSNIDPAMFIKYLTHQADIMITTRYHGLIFGLSSDIPTIALSAGEYYHQKNIGALKITYNDSYAKYSVNIENDNSHADLLRKFKYIQENLKSEKQILQQCNARMFKDKNFFSLDELGRLMNYNSYR